MNQFAQYLETVGVGEPVSSGNLAMFPLFRSNGSSSPSDAQYITFEDALGKDWVSVTEVDEAGSVPSLLLDNSGPQPILLLDGEQLVGAKQNRTVNLTLLIAAGVRTEIPVSCVEAGRWSRSSRKFHSSRHMHFNRGRREKMDQVSRSLRRDGARYADQGRVWDRIREKQDAFSAEAPTEAMDDIYAHTAARLEDYERELKPEPGQVGAIFVIDGDVSGFDLFAHPEHFHRYFHKLVSSHALDALETQAGAQSAAPAKQQVTTFLEGFRDAHEEEYDAIGLGSDLRVETPELIGAGLARGGDYVHLTGFPKAA